MISDFQSTPLGQEQERWPTAPAQPLAPPASPPSSPIFLPDAPVSILRRPSTYVALGAVFLVLALFSWYLFANRNTFSNETLTLAVRAPNEITAGDRVDFEISYENKSTVNFANAQLTFYFPGDSIVIDEEAKTTTAVTKTILIGDIKPGTQGKQTLSAFILGGQGDIKKAKAILRYRPDGIASDFEKTVEHPINITALAIPITVTAPPKVLSGQHIKYTIDFKNQTASDSNDLILRLVLPDDFVPSKFSPLPSDPTGVNDIAYGEKVWLIPMLAAGDSSRILIEGALTGTSGAHHLFVRLQRRIAIGETSQYVDFEKADAESLITPPLLSISSIVNDQKDYVALPGDDLRYKVTVTNQGELALSDLRVSAKLTGSAFDTSTLESEGVFDGRTGIISWDGTGLSSLRALGAGQSLELPFSIKLKEGSVSVGDPTVDVKTHVETDNVPATVSADLLSADDDLVTHFAASPTLFESLLVKDTTLGPPGAFPLRINQTSQFTIRWKVVNPLHGLSPARVSATLPPGIVWLENTSILNSSARPVYDVLSRTIVWDLGPLPQGVGTSQPAAIAYFQISVTPADNQIGQSLTLLKNIILEGTDTTTLQTVRTAHDLVMSTDVADSTESGQVQK